MTKETALPDLVGTLANLPEHIQATIREYGAACARTALQSPEVQRLREDARRLDFFIAEECQLQSLTLGNGTKFRLGWPDDGEAQSEWFASPRAAIDAAMEKQP